MKKILNKIQNKTLIKGLNYDGEKIDVIVKNETIVEVNKVEKGSNEDYKHYIIPGFIETHTHGGYNFDWSYGSIEESKAFLNKVAFFEGVTSVVGTTITTKKETIRKTLHNLSPLVNEHINGATFIGWHIEGPFISKEKKGAHPEEYIVPVTIDLLDEYLKGHYHDIRIITEAPENGSIEATEYLSTNGINPFVGHSLAGADLVKEHIKHGLKGVTHFNNAMVKYGTEGDSLAQYAIKSDDLYIEFINDGVHNSKDLAKQIREDKPHDKLMLVTDSLHVKGLKDGIYPGINWDIYKRDGAAYTPTGILNGSTYQMIKGFQDWINTFNTSIEEAVMITSTNQAKLLGLKKGKIEVGYDADILLLDKNYNIVKTFVNGKLVTEDKKADEILKINNFENKSKLEGNK